MTVVFKNNTGPYIGLGRRLTSSEVDGNFYDLLTRIIAVEGGGAFACSSVEYVEGGYIKFNWSDGSSSGPFPLALPMPRGQGVWTNNQQLLRLDIVSVPSLGYFLVLNDHVTPATGDFDPAALDGTGSDALYQQISPPLDMTAIMRWKDDWAAFTDYDQYDVVFHEDYGTFIVLADHASAATFDPEAIDSTGGDRLYKKIAPLGYAPVHEPAGGTYTVTASDAGKYIRFTTGCDIVFSSGIDVLRGTEITFRQGGDDPLYFTNSDTAVLLNPQREGYATNTPYKGATVIAKYMGDDEWDLVGPHGDAVSS